jgi:hypothetical protein
METGDDEFCLLGLALVLLALIIYAILSRPVHSGMENRKRLMQRPQGSNQTQSLVSFKHVIYIRQQRVIIMLPDIVLPRNAASGVRAGSSDIGIYGMKLNLSSIHDHCECRRLPGKTASVENYFAGNCVLGSLTLPPIRGVDNRVVFDRMVTVRKENHP